MKIVFVATTLLCVVMGYALPTQKLSPSCADPTYACQDLTSAHKCGVVKSCINEVWSTMSAPDDNNEICDICKEMVKEARDQLLSNMTQEEIREVFEGSCRLIHIKVIVDGCIKLVDSFIPDLIEMLASRMDPNMVCTVSGLCNMGHSLPKAQVETKAVKPVAAGDKLTCELCENLVQHAKDIISSQTTREEFKTGLLNFCHQLGGFSEECTKLVNDDFDMIYDFIVKEMDPHTVCVELGLCDQADSTKPLIKTVPARQITKMTPLVKMMTLNSASKILPLTKTFEAKPIHDMVPKVKITPGEINTKKDKYILHKKTDEEEDESNSIFNERFDHPAVLFKQDTECAFCKAMMFFLKNDLNEDRNEDRVKTALDSICSKWLKGYSKYCQSFLKQNYEVLQEQLTSGVDFIDICGKMNTCPKEEIVKEIAVSVVSPKPKGFIDCEICKKVVDMVRDRLQKPTTKATIEKLLDKVCNILPKSMQPKCTDFLHSNLDFIINTLLELLNADVLCKELSYCSVSKIELNVLLKSGASCDFCEFIVQQLSNLLEEPKVKADLKALLEKVCTYVPQSMADQCQEFFDENMDLIINFLRKELDPATVCTALGICPGSKLPAIKLPITPQPAENGAECELCKAVMKFVQQELGQQKTQEAILKALDKACTYLPKSWSTKCQNFVNEYTEIIIIMISQGMDPALVCSSLDVCSAQSFECPMCQDVCHYLQNQLYDNNTQEEIKNFAKRGCTLFPKTLDDNCEAFINEYGSSFLVLLAQQLDPNNVCVAMDMCPGVSKLVQIKPKPIEIKQLNLDTCSVCTTVVDYLDKLLEEDDVDREITSIIEKVCNVVPTSVQGKCASIIEAYGPYILQMIGQLANSKEVCQEIDLCPRVTGQVHLLGGAKCAVGPMYWCLTKAHAAACKAEEFCKQNNWKHN